MKKKEYRINVKKIFLGLSIVFLSSLFAQENETSFQASDPRVMEESFLLKGVIQLSPYCQIAVRRNLAKNRLQFIELDSRESGYSNANSVNTLEPMDDSLTSISINDIDVQAINIEQVLVPKSKDEPFTIELHLVMDNGKLKKHSINVISFSSQYASMSMQDIQKERSCFQSLQQKK